MNILCKCGNGCKCGRLWWEKSKRAFYRDLNEAKELLDKETAHGAVDAMQFWPFGLRLNGVMVRMLGAARRFETQLAALEGLLISNYELMET